MLTRCLAVLMTGVLLAAPANAAEYDDPSWPCIQRKVEALSPGLMWPHPLTPMTPSANISPLVDDLVGRLVLRRVDLDAARALVEDFATRTGADTALMGHVFDRVFTRMARDRRQIIAGIGDYSRQQIGLAERIDTARAEMDSAMASDTPDFDRVDRLEEQIDWDERIYTDRAKALTYVCETPVLLEKRLYAIAQILLAAASDG